MKKSGDSIKSSEILSFHWGERLSSHLNTDFALFVASPPPVPPSVTPLSPHFPVVQFNSLPTALTAALYYLNAWDRLLYLWSMR